MGVWRLLVIDGFGSHLSYEFYHYAQAHKIELFQLPPHSTHLTQPLDVGCFQPFKHHHAERLDETVRDSGIDFDKLDFLTMFRRMREKTFTKSTILSAWQKTGLIPYNPGVVIRKIQAIQDSRPVTPPSACPETPLLARTSRGPKELVDYGENLRRSMSKYDVVHPEYQLHIERFVKGAITNAHSHEITERDLTAVQKQAVAKAARKKLDGKVAQKGGVVTVGQIRAKIQTRDNEEGVKAQLALDRAIAAENRKLRAVINA